MKTIEERVEHYANKLESFKEELRGVNELVAIAQKEQRSIASIIDYKNQRTQVLKNINLISDFIYDLKEIAAAQREAPKRTDKQIIEQTNDIALMILKDLGFEPHEETKTYNTNNPRARGAWNLACLIQEKITQTDPSGCDFEEE